ncbi:MAG: hypothetical protein KAS12_06115 [Candidatus Aenigmarchaeota archaeon]|nr:hypothetical protein [Candidatus Aenigmarchaeota archaeon]
MSDYNLCLYDSIVPQLTEKIPGESFNSDMLKAKYAKYVSPAIAQQGAMGEIMVLYHIMKDYRKLSFAVLVDHPENIYIFKNQLSNPNALISIKLNHNGGHFTCYKNISDDDRAKIIVKYNSVAPLPLDDNDLIQERFLIDDDLIQKQLILDEAFAQQLNIDEKYKSTLHSQEWFLAKACDEVLVAENARDQQVIQDEIFAKQMLQDELFVKQMTHDEAFAKQMDKSLSEQLAQKDEVFAKEIVQQNAVFGKISQFVKQFEQLSQDEALAKQLTQDEELAQQLAEAFTQDERLIQNEQFAQSNALMAQDEKLAKELAKAFLEDEHLTDLPQNNELPQDSELTKELTDAFIQDERLTKTFDQNDELTEGLTDNSGTWFNPSRWFGFV